MRGATFYNQIEIMAQTLLKPKKKSIRQQE